MKIVFRPLPRHPRFSILRRNDATTATTTGARDHARAMAGTVVDAMPTMPASAATDLPAGVDARRRAVGRGRRRRRLRAAACCPRGARLRLTDLDGDACAGLLLHRADRPAERLNVADTVKVQWQAYLGAGPLLLSDMGRVLAAIVEDTSGRHDAFCGTTQRAGQRGRGTATAPPTARRPNGRDHFAVALAKLGLGRGATSRRTSTSSRASRVEPDGALALRRRAAGPARTSSCAASCRVLVTDRQRPPPARPPAGLHGHAPAA